MVAAAGAQAPLPIVPAWLPPALRDSLNTRRDTLAARSAEFAATGRAFNARCGTLPATATQAIAACAADQDRMRAELSVIMMNKRVFIERIDSLTKASDARCAEILKQLALDRAALLRQQHVNEASAKELEEWAKANLEAEHAAVTAGVKLLFGGVAKWLEAREGSATALQGVMDAYIRSAPRGVLPSPQLRAAFSDAATGYARARAMALTGQAMSASSDARELFEYARTEAGAVAKVIAQSNAGVKVLLADPEFGKFLQTDKTSLDLLRGTLDQMGGTSTFDEIGPRFGLERLGPAYALGSFAADYGYDVKKWLESRDRILQGAGLSDLELKAVDALSKQLVRTVAHLNACRAAP